MRIGDYINNNQNDAFFGSELEISIASSIYNLNIATFEEQHDNENLLGLSFIGYYNISNDNNRHLMILSNINNNHFRLGYVKANDINDNDLNFKLKKKTELETNSNNINNIIMTKNIEKLTEDFDLNSLFNLKDKKINEILNFYKSSDNNKVGLDDIYYYLYHKKNDPNGHGKYSDKFKKINKGKSYENKKNVFRKKCHKYNIDEENRLIKTLKITNYYKTSEELKDLIIIPNDKINNVLNYFHSNNGHKGYLYLARNIISNGYYINNIYRICQDFIQNCYICT